MTYTNPVIPGFYPDPSVCRVGEDYYLVTSSFEYFPGVPVFHSRDLVHWRQIGHCLTRASQLPLEGVRSSGGIYAPTIRHHNGTFYMVTTNVTGGGHFYVYTDDPADEWSEPVWVNQGHLTSSIDPSLFFDDDGRVYFTTNNHQEGIYQFEIDIATGKRLTEPLHLWAGTGGKYPEAPHLYKINGLYYLLISEGGTEYGHMVTIARGFNPYGPFESCPQNPILTHRSTDKPIQATGHADLVQAHDGSWWMVFLGIRPNGYPSVYHLGRETFLAPLIWTPDGWPIVGKVNRQMDVPTLPPVSWDADDSWDDFVMPQLRLCYNFLRNPRAEDWSVEERTGWLRLTGSAITLDDGASPAFVGRRQQHFNCRVSTGLDFIPQRDGEEAGLTVYMNEKHHYEIAIKRIAGERCIIVRRRIGSLSTVVALYDLANNEQVTLEIRADRDTYHFGYSLAGSTPHTIATGETRYLSTEVAGGFTGVYFGLYATGNGQPSTTPAYFDYIEYASLGE